MAFVNSDNEPHLRLRQKPTSDSALSPSPTAVAATNLSSLTKSDQLFTLSSDEVHRLVHSLQQQKQTSSSTIGGSASTASTAIDGPLEEEKERKIEQRNVDERLLASKEGRLPCPPFYKYDELPGYLQDNEYIRGG